MKLLISAYACAPHHGSEHAVGWNWTTEAHRLGHEVWVLASPAHRNSIETVCGENPDLAGIKWLFPEVPLWPLLPKREPKWERSYNLLWQVAALWMARKLHRTTRFDVVHHLTWGGVRAPTFLGSLGVPLIMGPLGGGETSPVTLRRDLRFKAQLTEWIRDLSNATITVNPIVRGGLTSAALIFVRTADTRKILARSMQKKSLDFIELSLRREQIGNPALARQGHPKLLFVGRLLYWKGVHIAIRAFAQLSTHIPGAQLAIVGSGPEEERLKADAKAYHLEGKIEFIPWLPQDRLFGMYDEHDLLIFPSLHDSGGTVVLEALSRGLPVICLDLGGPRHIVTPGSGIVIGTTGRDTAEVAGAMADEMLDLFAAPERLSALSVGAIARAGDFILSDRIVEFYSRAAASLNLPNKMRGLKHQGTRDKWVSKAAAGAEP